jgi:hypothetical protein
VVRFTGLGLKSYVEKSLESLSLLLPSALLPLPSALSAIALGLRLLSCVTLPDLPAASICLRGLLIRILSICFRLSLDAHFQVGNAQVAVWFLGLRP